LPSGFNVTDDTAEEPPLAVRVLGLILGATIGRRLLIAPTRAR
jgi:hypothetical protein